MCTHLFGRKNKVFNETLQILIQISPYPPILNGASFRGEADKHFSVFLLAFKKSVIKINKV